MQIYALTSTNYIRIINKSWVVCDKPAILLFSEDSSYSSPSVSAACRALLQTSSSSKVQVKNL